MPARLRRKGILSFLAVLLVITVWLFIFSSLKRLDGSGTSRNAETNIAVGGAELHRGSLRLNSSEFLQALAAPRRPLLVRFDWYSRKTTPVHIGYVGMGKISHHTV